MPLAAVGSTWPGHHDLRLTASSQRCRLTGTVGALTGDPGPGRAGDGARPQPGRRRGFACRGEHHLPGAGAGGTALLTRQQPEPVQGDGLVPDRHASALPASPGARGQGPKAGLGHHRPPRPRSNRRPRGEAAEVGQACRSRTVLLRRAVVANAAGRTAEGADRPWSTTHGAAEGQRS